MKTRYKVCPYCGKELGDSSEACVFCGNELTRGEEVNVKDFKDKEKTSKGNVEFLCKNCKNPIEKGEEECPNCGSTLLWDLPFDEHIKKLKKVVHVDCDIDGQTTKQTFNYYKNEVFYKNDIPSKFNYYFRRYLVVICFLLFGVILGIIPLCLLFGRKKPRNKYLLVKEDIIGIYEKGGALSDNKCFFDKREVANVTITVEKNNKNSVNIYIKGKDKPSGIFRNVYELDRLIKTLKKFKYNVKNN